MKSIDILLAYPKPSHGMANNMTCLSIFFPGAMFEAQGKRVAHYDERFDPPEMLDDLICRSSEIGVSSFTVTQAGQGARILKRAKELNPGIVTGVGGFHARFNPEATLAEEKWRSRDVADFPCEEVESLIASQMRKRQSAIAEAS
jgi:hypothetical protein